MQGQIARATPLSQLFIHINNPLQFWCGWSYKYMKTKLLYVTFMCFLTVKIFLVPSTADFKEYWKPYYNFPEST